MADKDFKVKTGLDLPAPLPLTEGGTGQTTASNAINALLPSQTSNTSKILGTDGTNVTWVNPGAAYQTSAPDNPVTGQLWVDSDETGDSLDPYIIRRKTITATAGQTVFATDVVFTDGYEQVYYNGVLLIRTTDYTTSGGTNTVTLLQGASAGDTVEIISSTPINLVNSAVLVGSNTFDGNQRINGRIGISGDATTNSKLDIFGVNSRIRWELLSTVPTEISTNLAANAYADKVADAANHYFKTSGTERFVITPTNVWSNSRFTAYGSTGDGDYTMRVHPLGGTSGQRSNLAFYATFSNFPQDSGPRRVADIIGGFSTGTWGTEYLSFNVGSSGDVQNLASEKMRINSSGTVAIGWTGDNNWGLSISTSTAGAGAFLATQSATNIASALLEATNNSYADVILKLKATRANTSSYSFVQALSSGAGDAEFNLRGDGQAYADGSWNAGGADYAEYFEWADGNPDNEDRRGYSVSLIGKKIKVTEDGETPIGVISGNPSIIGDAGWNSWNRKYLLDDFGSYVRDEDGERIINPDFDEELEYISREDRPEWAIVGLMGKLRLRKNQIVGAGWIKMDDISEQVEEWLVK